MSITISAHALIRYIERVKGVDLTPYRQEIKQIIKAGRHANPLEQDGFVYERVSNNHDTFVTAIRPIPTYDEEEKSNG